MSETEKRKKRFNATTGLRWGLALFMWAALSCFLAGVFTLHWKEWQSGEIAAYTVYAPTSLMVSEGDTTVQVERGELLATKGERLTLSQADRINQIHQMGHPAHARRRWAGAFLLAFLFLGIAASFLKRDQPQLWGTSKRLVLICLTVLLVVFLSRLILDSPWVVAGIPVATVAMLLAPLLGQRVAVVVGLLVALFVGIMVSADLAVLAGFGVGSFMGAYGVSNIRRRIQFFQAGFFTGLTQALTIGAGYLLLQWPLEIVWACAGAALLGGILSSLITFCLLPLLETAFGLITDVTLVELSDLNHPLLKELSVKAPGTYHHSLIVARLAEEACEAVGANGLLARVGCYFHDIGKMLHPEYFVENQPSKGSRHDKLAPSMSSLVILNHVKDGIRLGRQHRLNQAIIDFIPGHHGTGLIYYFYRRALEELEDESQLKEERFRYPGPKPHTKETAIGLLSDSVEAATRALKEKTPPRIQEVVRRIINNKFVDGQLDDCDLTLKDLNRIAEAFIRVLAGIYHTRVEYPKLPGEEEDQASSMTG